MDDNRYIPDHLRAFILKRDKRTCRYCGNRTGPFEIDHVYPFAKGGLTALENLVTACATCNGTKSSSIGIWPFPVGHFDDNAYWKMTFKYSGLFSLFTVLAMISLWYAITYFQPDYIVFFILFGGMANVFGMCFNDIRKSWKSGSKIRLTGD